VISIRTRWILVGLGFGLLFGLVQAEDGVQLSYRYPDGSTVVYKNRETVDLNMGVIRSSLQTEYRSEERKLDVIDGKQSMEFKMVRLAESTKIGGQLIPREVPTLLEGQAVWFKLDDRGNVTGFETGELSDLSYAEEKALKPILSNLKLGVPALYPELPDHPVSVGDTWETDREFTADDVDGVVGKTTIKAKYTVKRKLHRKGRLCYELLEISETTTNAIVSFGTMTVLVSGSGESKGKIEFDTEQGLIIKYDIRGKLKVDTTPVTKQSMPPTQAQMTVGVIRQLEDIRN
jgi:hypothetical protein